MYLIIWIYMFYPFFCCTESPATCNSVQSRFARPMYISLPVEVLTQIESRLQLTNSVHIRKNATKNITTIGADTELQNNKWPDIKKQDAVAARLQFIRIVPRATLSLS